MPIPGRYDREPAIELRHLRYVLAVAEAGSVTGAARRLGVAQPPLSRQIAAVERQLGVTLFERTTRGMRLTSAGQAFVERARRALAECEAAGADARAAATTQALRFAVPDYARGMRLCRAAVEALEGRLPAARVIGVATPGPGHEHALRLGQVDVGFGIAASPDDTGAFGADLAFQPLLHEEAAFALLPADHPLAAQNVIEPHRLAGLPLASFSRVVAPALYDRVGQAFAEAGLTPVRVPGEPTFGTCVQLVTAGMAWAFVIRSVAEHCPVGTVARRIAGINIVGVFGALWRPDSSPPLVTALIDELQALAAQERSTGS